MKKGFLFVKELYTFYYNIKSDLTISHNLQSNVNYCYYLLVHPMLLLDVHITILHYTIFIIFLCHDLLTQRSIYKIAAVDDK